MKTWKFMELNLILQMSDLLYEFSISSDYDIVENYGAEWCKITTKFVQRQLEKMFLWVEVYFLNCFNFECITQKNSLYDYLSIKSNQNVQRIHVTHSYELMSTDEKSF